MKRPTTADAHYFAFSAKDWRSSETVRLMPLACRGAFVDLLAVSWLASEEPCSIPSGDAEIAALLGVPVDEWLAIAPRVLAEFDETTKSGRLRNARLWREYQGMRSARRKMSQGGKASALRRRDEHGRLLPSPGQGGTKHPGKVPSGSPSPSPSPRKTTTSASRATWLTPIAVVWEAAKGAGSFRPAKTAGLLKSLRDAGHPPDEIATRLTIYLKRLDKPKYASLARFAETYADHVPLKLTQPDIVDGWLSPELDRLTAPAGRVA